MVTALLQGVQGQRFKLPLSGETAIMSGMDSYFSTLAEIAEKNADLLIKTGEQDYQGVFDQFNGKPAYQFTIDEAQLQEVLQELLNAVSQLSQQEITEMDMQLPHLVVEGSLVILGKDKVAVVVDTFEVITNEVHLIGNYRYSPDGYVLQMKEKES